MVAFVFIPLNFATSFFGMNLKQLDTGTLNIGWFILFALLSSTICYSMTRMIKPLESFVTRYRDQWQSSREVEWTDGHHGLRAKPSSHKKGLLAIYIVREVVRNTWNAGVVKMESIIFGRPRGL